MKLSIPILAFAISGAMPAVSQAQVQYTVTEVATPGFATAIVPIGVAGYGDVDPSAAVLNHAYIATPDAKFFSDIHPAAVGPGSSVVNGSLGSLIYGYASGTLTQNRSRPVIWNNGVPTILPTLEPAMSASVEATDGVQAVGYVSPVDFRDGLPIYGTWRAYLWNLSTGTAVDLSPNNNMCALYGVANGQQVGYISTSRGSEAALWSGTPNSKVSLHPNAFETSVATGTNGTTQVGNIRFSVNIEGEHGARAYYYTASIWQGSASSWQPLDGGSYGSSFANDIKGSVIVGYGAITNYRGIQLSTRALAWVGRNRTRIELHPFLSRKYVKSSAHTVTKNGTILGTAIDATGRATSVIWTPMNGFEK